MYRYNVSLVTGRYNRHYTASNRLARRGEGIKLLKTVNQIEVFLKFEQDIFWIPEI